MADYELVINVRGNDQTGSLDAASGRLGRIGEIAAGILSADVFRRIGDSVVDLGRQALTLATDFQTGMNVLQAQSGASSDEMEALRQKAIDLGADLTLPATSAADAGQAMLELSKAGLGLNDVLAASRGVLELSAAGEISNAQAAELAANALNAFHLSGDKASMVANLLSGAANQASGTVSDMGYSLQMAGTVANMAGQSVNDTVTAIALMANAGIQGSDAGTSLKTMLMRLIDPTDKAAGLMKELGINLFDANGVMLPMPAIINQFSSKLGGLTQEQRNAALATIFGTDAIRAASIVLMGGAERFNDMSAAVNRQGQAADMAAARMSGLGGAVMGLRSNVETALLQLALPALPWVTSVVTQVSTMVPVVVGWVGQMGASVVTHFTTAYTATQPFIQQALAVMGPIVLSLLPPLQALGASVGQVLSLAFQTLYPLALQAYNLFLSYAPLIGTVLIAAIGALNGVLQFLVTNWDNVVKIALVVGAALGAAGLVGIITTVMSTVGFLITVAQGLWIVLSAGVPVLTLVGGLVAALGGPITLVAALIAALAVAWSTNLFGIRDWTQQTWDTIKNATTLFLTNLSAAWTRNITDIRTAWDGWTTGLRTAWDTWHTGVTTAVTTWWTGLTTSWSTSLAGVRTNWDTWTGGLKAAWDTWHTNVSTATTTWWTSVSGTWDTWRGTVRANWDTWTGNLKTAWDTWHTNVQTAVTTWWTNVKDKWSETQGTVRGNWDTWTGNLKTAWDTWHSNVKTAVDTWWGGVKDKWSEVQGTTRSNWDTWTGGLKAAWDTWHSNVQTATATWWTSVKDKWAEVQGTTRGNWDTWSGNLKTAWEGWQNGIGSAVADWWANIGWRWAVGADDMGRTAWGLSLNLSNAFASWINNIGSWLNSFGESAGNWAWGLGNNIGAAFGAMIRSTEDAVRGWIDTLLGWLGDLIDSLRSAWHWMQRVGGGGEQPPAPPDQGGGGDQGGGDAGGGDGGGDQGGGGDSGEGFATGGVIPMTARYLLHAGEVVLNPQQQMRVLANVAAGGAAYAANAAVDAMQKKLEEEALAGGGRRDGGKGGDTYNQNVSVTLSTAAGLTSTLAMLQNMAKAS